MGVFGQEHQVELESILIGHSDMVSSLHWGQQEGKTGSRAEEDLVLLSCAFDFSTFVWQKESSSLWVNICQLGQMSGNKNAFFNARFSPSGAHILAYCYNGSACLYSR